MKYFVFLALIVLMKALVVLPQDAPPSVSCSVNLLTWHQALDNCERKSGYMFPYETGLGVDIDKLQLKSETDIWTADYFTVSNRGTDQLCGFNYLNSTLYEINEVFYGDCNANRNYFCKNEENGGLVVYNSTRDNVQCKYNVSKSDLQSMKPTIKPGYYWTSGRFHGTVTTHTNNLITPRPGGTRSFCGAYKSSIGRYFAACKLTRFSLCTSNGDKPKNKSCFEGQTASVTEHTAIVTKTMETPMASRSDKTAHRSAASPTQPMTVLTSGEDNTNVKNTYPQEEEQSSDIGIKVGVPLGIILPLTCGVLIIIYIYRKRIKCWQSCIPNYKNGRMNQFLTHKTAHARGQLNVYSENIQDTPTSPEQDTNENNPTDISAQYAVVKKHKKGDSKSKKDNYPNKSYQNGTNDEYDVTGRFQACTFNPSDNLYNHFENVDEYNSTSFVMKGECHNLNNTTGHRNLIESTYDSATQVNNTALTDDVYNHLS